MIEYDLCAHGIHDMIKALGGKSFKEGVCFALGAHAVHDLGTLQVFVDHAIHRVDVVLTVAVNRNGNVALVLGLHQTGENGVLMAAVAALADADIMRVLACKITDELPSAVFGAVVDEADAALVTDFSGRGKAVDFV